MYYPAALMALSPWDPHTGIGTPAPLSEKPPGFHPLTLLEPDAAPWLGMLLAAAATYLLLRGRGRRWAAAAAVGVGLVLALQPPLALFGVGVTSTLLAMSYFGAGPPPPTPRTPPPAIRWLVLVVTIALAFLGTRPSGFVLLGLTIVIAAVALAREQLAGALAAALAGALLAMPWILSGFIFQPEEFPAGGRSGPCALRTVDGIRLFDAQASSFHCTSSRVQGLFQRQHDRLLVLQLAGIGRRGPDVRLAKSFRVTPVAPATGPLSPEVTMVDHVPPKVARLGAGFPQGDVRGAGGTIEITRSDAGHIAARVRSNGWNLLVTGEPAWSGWRAYWNGERLPPVVVNHAFVGTFVPPGDGLVTVRYAPDAFDEGLRLAAIGFLIAIGTAVWPWYLRVPALRLPRVATLRTPPPAALGVLAVAAYAVLLCVHFTPVAGGADSSGYANQARLWRTGDLIVPLAFPQSVGLPPEFDHLFIPLGFVHGREPYTMVPSYPPGLPLMMAAASLIAGEHASFFIVALVTALALPLMVRLGIALGLTRAWAVAGAAILALFPTLLFMGIQPMTDSIATTIAIAAVLCALRGDGNARLAAAAGALFGFGVLIRPTQFLLLPAILILLRFRPRSLLALGLGGLPFAIVQGTFGYLLYGSPFSTGYGGLDYLMSAEGAWIRFRHYAYWMAALGSPIVFPGGLAVMLAKNVETRIRAALVAWFAAFFLFYTFYPPYETWWYTRFLLPALPALILGALLAIRALAGSRRALRAVLVAAIVAVELFQVLRIRVLDWDEKVYVRSTTGSRRHVPPGAIVLASQLSGAVRYYTGWNQVRWDLLDANSYGLVQRAAGARPWYALVAAFELDDAKRRAPGEWTPIEQFDSVTLYRVQPRPR